MSSPNAINALAIGHGEPCPFCVQEKRVKNIFISQADNDIVLHMVTEHKSDFNNSLFPEQ